MTSGRNSFLEEREENWTWVFCRQVNLKEGKGSGVGGKGHWPKFNPAVGGVDVQIIFFFSRFTVLGDHLRRAWHQRCWRL